MGFFDHDQPRSAPERESEFPDEAVGRNGWIGGVVADVLVLARSPAAVVAVTQMAAFPHGLEVTVSSFVRRLPQRWIDRGSPSHHPAPGFEDLSDDHLRFGIEFPSGERVDNVGPDSWPPVPNGEGHGLLWNGGGGGMTGSTWDYWVWPLPAGGDVSFVCEWPVFDIPESRVMLDAAAFVEAAGRAQRIWPAPSSGRAQ